MNEFKTLYSTVLGPAAKYSILQEYIPQPESDLEAFYVRKGRYAVMAANDLHVFGETFCMYRDAEDYATELAQIQPGKKYIVIYLDTTVVTEVPVKPQLIKRPPLV